jgi:hypothetical protein
MKRERIFGKPAFIALTRNPTLPRPERKFEPTKKQPGDIVIS